MNSRNPSIGIVGGMGPEAGIDLFQKILACTPAHRDQDHLPVLLASFPADVPDRTEFLLGRQSRNPAEAISRMACMLSTAGAVVAGIPCNTAHAEPILSVVRDALSVSAPDLRLVDMVAETASMIRADLDAGTPVGVLSTSGVRLAGIYRSALSAAGLVPVESSEREQSELVTPAIYDSHVGIKATGRPVSHGATSRLEQAAAALVSRGASVIVLGCTEIPLAVRTGNLAGVPVIDPTNVLAAALVREYNRAVGE